jgi:hypothetical protein
VIFLNCILLAPAKAKRFYETGIDEFGYLKNIYLMVILRRRVRGDTNLGVDFVQWLFVRHAIVIHPSKNTFLN